MKQIIVAVMLLATAVTPVSAQEAHRQAARSVIPELTPSYDWCRVAPDTSTCPSSGAQVRPSPEPSAPAHYAFPNGSVPGTARKAADEALLTDGTLHTDEALLTDEALRADTRFRWGSAFKQSMLFLSVQHGYALTQPKTRRSLSGNFLKDYARSVRSLRGWADGGRFFTNYVAHPMQGSLMGFVQIQNDPAGSRRRFDMSGDYWRSRMKALAWSAAWSTQFEIGPLSQASIGNVGLHGKQTYVDLVMTPTAGLGLLVAEDAIDRHVIEKIERRTRNTYARIFSRTILNPTRTAANLLRFKKPWYRDKGMR